MSSDRPHLAAFLTMLTGVLLIYTAISQIGKSGIDNRFSPDNSTKSANISAQREAEKNAALLIQRQKILAKLGVVTTEIAPPDIAAVSAMSPASDNVVYANSVNFPAVESHQTALSAPENFPSPRRYQVKSGDTLFRIAKQIYGDGSQWEKIRAANGLDRGKTLVVGQRLIIP